MFVKAERKKARLRLGLTGPSGAGKTLSALLVAMGIVGPKGKIAMIDTEAGSGELYAGQEGVPDYDVARISAPFDPAKYVAAIHEAEKAGYELMIIDSLSHCWEGEGGILDIKEAVAKASRSGNSYTAWRDVTPQHNRLVNAILQSPMHMIVTMRSKTAYELQDDGNGKKKPVKVGLAPVQRDGMEYEFTTVLDIAVEGHYAKASKDRTRLFSENPVVLTNEWGEKLRDWLDTGRDVHAEVAEQFKSFKKRIKATKNADALRELLDKEIRDWVKGDNLKDEWVTLARLASDRFGELTAAEQKTAQPSDQDAGDQSKTGTEG